MAPWCLSVIVLFCIQHVIARDCSSMENIRNCNECIRCGGIWCNVSHMNRHCGESSDASWCPNNRELLHRGPSQEEPGTSLQPALVVKTALVGSEPEILKIRFDQQTKNPKPPISVSFVNSSITNMQTSFEVHVEPTECRHGKCAAGIVAKPLTDFCPVNGSVAESVTIRVNTEGLKEEAVVQYQVPCACDCSQAVERFSQRCNGHGDYSCGACSCHDGWEGEFCDAEERPTKPPPLVQCNNDRGDISGECITAGLDESEQVCSGNGLCECGQCKCFPDRPNYKYFNSYCEDICVSPLWCDHCIFNAKPGICEPCNEVMIIENTTVVPDNDVWVKCNETRGDCTVRYAAMRDDNNEVRVIVLNSCDSVQADHRNHQQPAGPVNITVPIVLGIVALLASAAAVAGFMAWKHRTPPLPLTDPQYTNIGAEDCTGINPLYKPPTSSFKNPTYGKC